MHLLTTLIHIFWFVDVTRAVYRYMPPADVQRPMQAFTAGNGDSGGYDGKTWVAAYTEESFDEMNMEILHRIASAHFNWLLTQNPRYKITNGRGTCLVAAVWAPDTKSIYVSTMARGPYWKLITNFDPDHPTAPVWRARATHWKDRSKTLYHAEDSAYYWFEETRRTTGHPIYPTMESIDPETTKYPVGSMIATWGFHSQDPSDVRRTGRPIALCSVNDLRGVTCQQMANDLGVQFDTITNQPPAEQAVDSSPPDDDEVSGDPCQMNAAKRDNADFLHKFGKRDDENDCSVSYVLPTTFIVSTITGLPSPASSYDKGPSTSSIPVTTPPPPPPKPSCVMQDMDPGLGITAPGCICEGTTTLPLLSLPSASVYTQSCDYTALPTKTLPNPITIATETWTVGCQSCTGVGGAEVPADATCASIPSCTVTPLAQSFGVLLSNSSITVGDADDKNGGKDLRQNLYNQLHPLCPDNSNICDFSKGAEIKNMGTVVSGGDAYLTLQAKIIGSQ